MDESNAEHRIWKVDHDMVVLSLDIWQQSERIPG